MDQTDRGKILSLLDSPKARLRDQQDATYTAKLEALVRAQEDTLKVQAETVASLEATVLRLTKALLKARATATALRVVGDQMYRAIVYTSGVSLDFAADDWKRTLGRESEREQ